MVKSTTPHDYVNSYAQVLEGYRSLASGGGDMIYGVYTLVSGQPQEVFHSRARNRYYYTGGSFLNEGSSGAMYSDIMLLTVSGGNTYIRDGVYTDGDRAEIYFRVYGGDRYSGYSTAISEEEFNAARNTY